PFRDGKAFSPEEWICEDDLPQVNRKIELLDSGRSWYETLDFRSDHFGERRYYRMLLSRDEGSHSPMLFGAIQDVTTIARSMARIRESQELWEVTINSIPILFFVKDVDDGFRYVQCNRMFASFVGLTPEEVIGRTDLELMPVPEESHRTVDWHRRIVEGAETEELEENFTGADGVLHRFRTVGKLATGIGGKRLLLGVSDDITELSRVIQYEQVNSEILKYAVSETDFDRVLQRIVTTLLRTLACERVVVAACNQEGCLELRSEAYSEHLRPIREGSLKWHQEYWNRYLPEIRSHRFLFESDLLNIPDIQEILPQTSDYPKGSVASGSIFVDGELWGILAVSFGRKYDFSRSDEKLIQAMGDIITLAWIRSCQNEAVRRAEQLHQLILDNLNVPIWLYNTEGVIVTTNRSAEHLVGFSQIDTPPYSCRECLGCGFDEENCPVAQALRDDQPHQMPYHRNGREYIIDARPVHDESGKTIYVAKSSVDVTKHHQLIGNQQVVNECLSFLIGERNADHAINQSLKRVCEHVGASHCHIFRFDSQTCEISCLAEYSRSGRSLFLQKGQPYAVEPDLESRFADGGILSFPDVQRSVANGEMTSWDGLIQKYDIRSMYACRIMQSEKFWGYICLVYVGAPYQFSGEDVDFFHSVAHCVELLLVHQQYQE
ncbi:MAG: PAS domain S-box protein, partial [Planctomycetia bacterium]|nr:PAS domain S-box protein [Planctomycetia bacterium]